MKREPVRWWCWVSCVRFTVCVGVDDRLVVVWAAPLVKRFVGQPLANLHRWTRSLGPGFAACWWSAQ